MLMTKFIFLVHVGQDGHHHTVITRVADGAQKYFYQCGGSVEGLTNFFESITDELMDGCFPKANKKGSDVDNWAFLGPNPDRAKAEELARIDLTHRRLTHTI